MLNQRGFEHIGTIILIVFVGGGVLFAGGQVAKQASEPEAASSAEQGKSASDKSTVRWNSSGDGTWQATGAAPACKDPFIIKSPTPDLTKATSVLMPGQTRGGNYKPHGGLRFDNQKTNDLEVVAPFEGYLYRGARYFEQGELQYSFDFINPCGYMAHFDHLRQLSPVLQRYADNLPPAQNGDSRTTVIESAPTFKANQEIANAVGFSQGPNVGFDFGVYDLRNLNASAQTDAFKAKHQNDKELSWHGVCWLDMLPSHDAAFVNNLPGGDQLAGKTSDYCQ